MVKRFNYDMKSERLASFSRCLMRIRHLELLNRLKFMISPFRNISQYILKQILLRKTSSLIIPWWKMQQKKKRQN